MIARFALTWSAADIADMRECPDGDYVRWADHVEAVCRYRDKLMEICKACSTCDGTGIVQKIRYAEAPLIDDCPTCNDLREILA